MNNPVERFLLILEDSQTLAHLARQKIEKNTPFKTVWASSLEQALTMLDSGQYHFEKALVDLTLPDAAGEEIIDALQPYHLHLIVMTGTFGKEWRGILQGKNVVDYFVKNKKDSYDDIVSCLNRLDQNAQIQILVVDDSISYRSLLKRMLSLQNYQVLMASSGSDALTCLAAHPNILLVITDYLMKDMNGVMLTEAIRQKYKPHRLGLIGISATEDLSLSAQFLKAGASDFLRKPFSVEEFNCRVEQNIQRMEQLELLQKSIDVKDHFLGIAAHDLRSPMGIIYSYCQLFLGGNLGDLTEDQAKVLSQIKKTTAQSLSLLDGLLDISAIESGKLNLRQVNADILPMVHERIEMQRMRAREKGIQLDLDIQSVPAISHDPERLGQVIDNFISNAIKYSPLKSSIKISLLLKSESIYFAVQDYGPGLSPEEQARLFKPFERLNKKTTAGESSTGLGLAIVRKIAESHGWKVSCESNLEQGSTFQLWIPLSPALAGSAA
jgi:two-component system, sensor histidine kinase and response regulator